MSRVDYLMVTCMSIFVLTFGIGLMLVLVGGIALASMHAAAFGGAFVVVGALGIVCTVFASNRIGV